MLVVLFFLQCQMYQIYKRNIWNQCFLVVKRQSRLNSKQTKKLNQNFLIEPKPCLWVHYSSITLSRVAITTGFKEWKVGLVVSLRSWRRLNVSNYHPKRSLPNQMQRSETMQVRKKWFSSLSSTTNNIYNFFSGLLILTTWSDGKNVTNDWSYESWLIILTLKSFHQIRTKAISRINS